MKPKKIAFITGVNGQDGSYLAELLLEKGYEVHGMIRHISNFNIPNIEHIFSKLNIHYGDLSNGGVIKKLIYKIKPDEVYNLGAQSQVRVSFDVPEYTLDVTGLGVLRVLEAIKNFQEITGKKVKFYQASSSEIFGLTPPPQNEKSLIYPRSPYGCAKVLGFYLTKNYREAYNTFAVNGILFNHESPRRGDTFVTKKITRGFARIKSGLDSRIHLGNLDAKRDWGYAPEFVEAMWLMMQQKKPDDYVIATGKTHSVREFVEEAGKLFGFDIYWSGKGLNENGIDRKSNKVIISINSKYFRPTEVNLLIGDYNKAQKILGWKPRTHFKDLVKIMAEDDLNNFNSHVAGSTRDNFFSSP